MRIERTDGVVFSLENRDNPERLQTEWSPATARESSAAHSTTYPESIREDAHGRARAPKGRAPVLDETNLEGERPPTPDEKKRVQRMIEEHRRRQQKPAGKAGVRNISIQ